MDFKSLIVLFFFGLFLIFIVLVLPTNKHRNIPSFKETFIKSHDHGETCSFSQAQSIINQTASELQPFSPEGLLFSYSIRIPIPTPAGFPQNLKDTSLSCVNCEEGLKAYVRLLFQLYHLNSPDSRYVPPNGSEPLFDEMAATVTILADENGEVKAVREETLTDLPLVKLSWDDQGYEFDYVLISAKTNLSKTGKYQVETEMANFRRDNKVGLFPSLDRAGEFVDGFESYSDIMHLLGAGRIMEKGRINLRYWNNGVRAVGERILEFNDENDFEAFKKNLLQFEEIRARL